MLRIPSQGDAFLFSRPPASASGSVESAVLKCLEGAPLPDLIYWDGETDEETAAQVMFGKGGLDPFLATQYDISGCVAVREGILNTVAGGQSQDDATRVTAMLARSPVTRSLWCPGLSGRLSSAQNPAAAPRRGAHVDAVSIALILHKSDLRIEPFFAALANQELDAKAEVVIVACNMGSREIKALAAAVESCAAADTRLRIRRYNLAGTFERAYLANVAVALTTGESVVIADPRCAPRSPHLIQALASWAAGSDVASACPRIEHDGALLCAGLGVIEADAAVSLGLSDSSPFSEGLRLTAAPAPWLFAVRRNSWLASGGLVDSARELWTAPLAGAAGPRGRHLLIGSESAEWTEADAPSRSVDPAPTPLRPASLMALRVGHRSPPATSVRGTPKSISIARIAEAPTASRVTPAFSDSFPNQAPVRALVFADAFGPSQAIAFERGLASARLRGTAAVRLVEESAFAQTPDAVRAEVQAMFAETRPTVAVVSRMGSQVIWRAVRREARRTGTLLVFHIDDDLLNPPVSLGIERYRVAMHPRRVHTLYDCLAECDLTLAASPALARHLEHIAGHRRITSMAIGSAAAPPSVRSAPTETGRIVIGYMGSASHNHDLIMIAPAVNRILASYDHVDLALFGSIARQPAAKLFQDRAVTHPGVVRNYAGFRQRLAELRFDIGLAPLRDVSFNRCKTPTKWVEYAEAGIACLVSDIEPYHPIIEAGAVVAARPDEWEAALRQMVECPALRMNLVRKSDRLLRSHFGWDRLERSVLAALSRNVAIEDAA